MGSTVHTLLVFKNQCLEFNLVDDGEQDVSAYQPW